MNESKEQFKNGNLSNTSAAIEDAFKTKNTLYYLEMGEVERLMGPAQIPSSTKSLLVADQRVERWQIETSDRLKRSVGDVSSYVLSEGVVDEYDPKLYEISYLSQTLALNHVAQGHWDDAMVEGKKMAQREKQIEQIIQGKVAAISTAEQNQQLNPSTHGATSRIDSINGYPVNLLDTDETRNLKNAYQNPSAYYLSAFIHESQGETSLAAPGYRLAFELRPSIPFFKTSLANLDVNVKNRSQQKNVADTLVIVDTGFIPNITPYKINQTFAIAGSSKIITLTFPVIERASERFTPNSMQIGNVPVNPEMVTNLDAMARKNLKDEMPGYILRATSRALVSLAAQYAADRAVQEGVNKRQNNQNNGNGAIAGAIAGLITGIAFQAVNVTDVRHWSTLPSATYMTRLNLPVGINVLRYKAPSGAILSQTINLLPGYNVVYLRMFRDRASILVSNDPAALSNTPISDTPVASGNAVDPVTKPQPGFFDGLKAWVTSPADPKGSGTPAQGGVVPSASAAAPSTSSPIPSQDSSSGNMEVSHGYEPPNFLDAVQSLFK